MPKTLCIDFDGVIHSYTSGWQGATVIADEPVELAFKWLTFLANRYTPGGDPEFELCIYSSRSKDPGGIEAMIEWFHRHGLAEEVLELLSFPTQKPAAWLTIDDRAFCFEGEFPSARFMLEFKPWNKKDDLAEYFRLEVEEEEEKRKVPKNELDEALLALGQLRTIVRAHEGRGFQSIVEAAREAVQNDRYIAVCTGACVDPRQQLYRIFERQRDFNHEYYQVTKACENDEVPLSTARERLERLRSG